MNQFLTHLRILKPTAYGPYPVLTAADDARIVTHGQTVFFSGFTPAGVVVTEQGLAELRGLGPLNRARTIIDRCAHTAYRDYLHRYLKESRMGHICHDLKHCFDLHRNLMAHGTMLPDKNGCDP